MTVVVVAWVLLLWFRPDLTTFLVIAALDGAGFFAVLFLFVILVLGFS